MKKRFLLLCSVLFLSGCSSSVPSASELFAGAYGKDPVSATFDQSLIMEGYSDDMNMSIMTVLTLEDVFDSKAHIHGVLGGADASMGFEFYKVEKDGKTLTYTRNSVGNFNLIQEEDGFSPMIPELDIGRYDNLKVSSEKDKWLVVGTIPVSELSGLEIALEDVDLTTEFTFSKQSGYLERMYFDLPTEIELSDSVVTSLILDIRVSKINETDFELPEVKEARYEKSDSD